MWLFILHAQLADIFRKDSTLAQQNVFLRVLMVVLRPIWNISSSLLTVGFIIKWRLCSKVDLYSHSDFAALLVFFTTIFLIALEPRCANKSHRQVQGFLLSHCSWGIEIGTDLKHWNRNWWVGTWTEVSEESQGTFPRPMWLWPEMYRERFSNWNITCYVSTK